VQPHADVDLRQIGVERPADAGAGVLPAAQALDRHRDRAAVEHAHRLPAAVIFLADERAKRRRVERREGGQRAAVDRVRAPAPGVGCIICRDQARRAAQQIARA